MDRAWAKVEFGNDPSWSGEPLDSLNPILLISHPRFDLRIKGTFENRIYGFAPSQVKEVVSPIPRLILGASASQY
jgi:hypothetical protein